MQYDAIKMLVDVGGKDIGIAEDGGNYTALRSTINFRKVSHPMTDMLNSTMIQQRNNIQERTYMDYSIL